MPEPDWKRFGYSSLESYIEHMAGASPPDDSGQDVEFKPCGWCDYGVGPCTCSGWPMPPHPGADDEDEATPDG